MNTVQWKTITLPALLILCFGVATHAEDRPGRVYSTPVRMSEAHLAAAHADVLAIQAKRREVAWQTGLNDYKGIDHAHAGDSSHTGGTLPEMLRDAKRAGVSVVLLTNHFRPPRDFIEDNRRGMHEGVLFIPGSEAHGFLIHPEASVMDVMGGEKSALLKAVTAGKGLAFLSHVEERVDHPMDGLTGMEVYNRHADAKDDMVVVMSIVSAVTDPDKLAAMQALLDAYPNEVLATQLDYPSLYMAKWDRESQLRRIVGIAANDCHHNQVFVTKKVDDETVLVGTIVDPDDGMRTLTARQYPGIRALVKGHAPGEIVAKLDFDPYYRAFYNVSTHILAQELNESSIRDALLAGHAYVSHDWMCDPTGAFYGAFRGKAAAKNDPSALMGDEIDLGDGLTLVAAFPAPSAIRLLRNGETIRETHGRKMTFNVTTPGVYRTEAWFDVDGEHRPWIYTNPIYVR